MRNIIVTILVFCITAGFSLCLASIQPEDIVGVWLLDEGEDEIAKDVSGNEHHGEVVAENGKAEWATGKFGQALYLESGGHVMIPHDDSLNLVEFTISVWVKVPEVLTPYQFVVGKED